MSHTPTPWRYEPETKTIRHIPTNYWLATMDSWDGAVDHVANAEFIVRCVNAHEKLIEALQAMLDQRTEGDGLCDYSAIQNAREALKLAKGE